MEFTAVLNARRSIRSFTGELISDETRQKLLHAANASPVGMGRYDAVHLTVVKSREMLDVLEENAARVFGMSGRRVLYNAPELILVSTASADNVGYSNAAILAHSMALAAVDEGVGVCHIWGCVIALSRNSELMARLGIPEGFTPACAVAVGMTEERYAPRDIPDGRVGVNVV